MALALLTLFLAGAAWAQNKGALIVQCNVSGAQVLVNGKLVGNTTPNFSTLLPPGKYTVRVTKPRYVDFNSTVNLTAAGVTLQVNLAAVGAPPGTPPGPPPPPPVVQHVFSVNANVPGAEVFVNGNRVGKTPFGSQVPPGSYALVVRAPGFVDYSQNVLVNGPTQINANLQPIAAQLTVTSNVNGAEVFINGNRAGTTPFSSQVPPGSYALVVRVAGFVDYSQNILVNGPTQINANLQPLTHQLSVDATNFRGAQVVINGNAVGQTPFVTMLPPGSYSVVIKAPGYSEFAAGVTLDGPEKITATLQPAQATWQFVIPESMINKDLKGGHWSQIQIYVDGAIQKGQSAQVMPGRHVIRIVSGALSFESAINFEVGKTYSLEPSLGVVVK